MAVLGRLNGLANRIRQADVGGFVVVHLTGKIDVYFQTFDLIFIYLNFHIYLYKLIEYVQIHIPKYALNQ